MLETLGLLRPHLPVLLWDPNTGNEGTAEQ